jgi:hypothetical protein
MEWPTAVAIYAALIATLTAAWNIRNGLRDRGRLSLEVRFRKILMDAHGRPFAVDVSDLKGTKLVLTITNTGRRPITITSWLGTYREPVGDNRFFYIVPTGRMPLQLAETQQHDEIAVDFRGVFDQGFKEMFVIDTIG